MFLARSSLVLLVALLDDLSLSRSHISEESILNGVVEKLSEGLLVSSALHEIKLVITVAVEPEDVTARLEQHEVELMREAGLCHRQNHSLLADLLCFFWCLNIISSLLLAEVKALNQQLASILLGCTEVVAAEGIERIFNLEDLNLELSPLRATLQTSFVHLDVELAIREVFFYIDNKLARYFCLVDACCE